jgi:hypothetical protein
MDWVSMSDKRRTGAPKYPRPRVLRTHQMNRRRSRQGLLRNWPIDTSKISTVALLRSSFFSFHSANSAGNAAHAVTGDTP